MLKALKRKPGKATEDRPDKRGPDDDDFDIYGAVLPEDPDSMRQSESLDEDPDELPTDAKPKRRVRKPMPKMNEIPKDLLTSSSNAFQKPAKPPISGSRPFVFFPENSEELDKLNEDAQKLLAFRLNDGNGAPSGDLFLKE